MPLDPQAQAFLDQMAASGAPPLTGQSVGEARQAVLAFTQLGGDPEPVTHVGDRKLPGPDGAIPVRIYTPSGGGPFPVLVYFHGGGWVLCDIETHDPICRSLANGAHCIVVSVDYRLAPEHKFPAAADDCYAATQWVMNNSTLINGDPELVAVGGDSAGGNLAGSADGARPRRPGADIPTTGLSGHGLLRARHSVVPAKRGGLLPDQR